jgi:hypothetical protein
MPLKIMRGMFQMHPGIVQGAEGVFDLRMLCEGGGRGRNRQKYRGQRDRTHQLSFHWSLLACQFAHATGVERPIGN